MWACHTRTWTADKWRLKPGYGDGDDPTVQLCERFPHRPDCVPILYPPYIDPKDFNSVCADAPQAEWLSFDWLAPWIGHYAECLFVPLAPLDHEGHLRAAWEGSAGGALAATAERVIDSFSFEGNCGQLGPSFEIGGYTAFFDTCTWSWAAGLKAALFWIVILLGVWRAVGFFIATTAAAFDANMPNPMPAVEP